MNNVHSYEKGYTVEVYKNQCLAFEMHRKGFIVYSLVQGDNTVLILEREENDPPGSSARLITELALELKGEPPLSETLESKDWIINALYRCGGPKIQFESTRCSGNIVLDSKSGDGKFHGKLSLIFFEPSIDLGKSKEASVRIAF